MTQQAQIGMALTGAYRPAAVYYEEADIVEYVRDDVPVLHRRVDAFLTLVLDLEKRQPIGFTLKGFRNFYLKHVRPTIDDADFVRLTTVLETAMTSMAGAVFDEYEKARTIAEKDAVELHELPKAA